MSGESGAARWDYYRANDFARAASEFDRLPDSKAWAAKLRSFGDDAPYQRSGPPSTLLPFVLTDPLPVVEIRVEGVGIHVLIDTGGGELILDAELAAELGVTLFGSMQGTFAGGRRAKVEHGRVERVALGEIELHRVPVMVMATRRFSPITGGRHRIDGIIGTNLLAQFRSTLDFPAGRLRLELLESEPAAGGVEVAFETVRAHQMIANAGWLNGIGPLRFFVDSGLAGGAFSCRARTLERAGIPVPDTADRGGVGGGGGPVATGIFEIDELGLGPLRQRNLRGVYVAPANAADDRTMPVWDGLISHGFLRKYKWTIDPVRSVFVFV